MSIASVYMYVAQFFDGAKILMDAIHREENIDNQHLRLSVLATHATGKY